MPFVLGVNSSFDFLTGEGKSKPVTAGQTLKFSRAIVRQWWRLRARKSNLPLMGPDIIHDPHGNLVIRGPGCLDAAEAQASQGEWLRAVESANVMFDLTDTKFADSTGIGALIRLRRRSRELGWQFFLIAPHPPVESALKLMKLDEFFTIQASLSGARIVMESAAGAMSVSSGVQETELQIRWTGEVTALNAVELRGLHRVRVGAGFPGHDRGG